MFKQARVRQIIFNVLQIELGFEWLWYFFGLILIAKFSLTFKITLSWKFLWIYCWSRNFAFKFKYLLIIMSFPQDFHHKNKKYTSQFVLSYYHCLSTPHSPTTNCMINWFSLFNYEQYMQMVLDHNTMRKIKWACWTQTRKLQKQAFQSKLFLEGAKIQCNCKLIMKLRYKNEIHKIKYTQA